MKKVAIFGNAGAGKSTLAKQLADITQLPLVTIDKIMYQTGGAINPHADYLSIHAEIIKEDEWIIDGYGCAPSAWERFGQADTLIYIDLPLFVHIAWVTKRFIKGLFINPEGWPERAPMLKSTMTSYRVVWLCHRKLTPRYRQYVVEVAAGKQVFRLRSPREIAAFLKSVR